MPQSFELKKMLNHYFKDVEDEEIDENILSAYEKLFCSLSFLNPRHLKKVLNQYEYCKHFINSGKDEDDVLFQNPSENVELTIITLYIIICKEFYKDKYDNLCDYDRKILTLKNRILEYNSDSIKTTNNYNEFFSQIEKVNQDAKNPQFCVENCKATLLESKQCQRANKKMCIRSDFGLVLYLLPHKLPRDYEPEMFGKNGVVKNYFSLEFLSKYDQSESEIEVNFIKYLIEFCNNPKYVAVTKGSNISILSLIRSIDELV